MKRNGKLWLVVLVVLGLSGLGYAMSCCTGGTSTESTTTNDTMMATSKDKSKEKEPVSQAKGTKKFVKKVVYVCPMNDYTGAKPGKCPKCGMKLEKQTVIIEKDK